ncbi:hypothetical protein GcM3_045023 [Golovinomyces cichoracearum]|uniref:F-box domain-containing protein n=1 Tax=Golovinomyces cichoracearum TaxID=62708 RepID=A0A420J143_9PEZI|nr:hypothetical protein GcM3_045023 [Golovinomyces cichoracearum]
MKSPNRKSLTLLNQMQGELSCQERFLPPEAMHHDQLRSPFSSSTTIISSDRKMGYPILPPPMTLTVSCSTLPSLSPNYFTTKNEMENSPTCQLSLKRKSQDSNPACKKKLLKDCNGVKRTTKYNSDRSSSRAGILVSERICDDLWMRIFELTDPRFLSTKGRFICRRFTDIIDNRNSIFVNQRIQTYGRDMPGPPPGMSERQYSNLLGGKGCEECSDRACTSTKWAWSKRWCASCWGKRIIREDRAIKKYQNDYPQGTILQILACLPFCMHDSHMKPHDVNEDRDSRPPGGPKIHKYFQIQNVTNLVAEYDGLAVKPKDELSGVGLDHDLAANINDKRQKNFTAKKKENDKLMERVCKIEIGIRIRRREIAQLNKKTRKGRREYHSKMARLELLHIPIDFIQKGKAYKSSCRIYRNAGTERTWKTLKPKIENEWRQEQEKCGFNSETVTAAIKPENNNKKSIHQFIQSKASLSSSILYHLSISNSFSLTRSISPRHGAIPTPSLYHNLTMPYIHPFQDNPDFTQPEYLIPDGQSFSGSEFDILEDRQNSDQSRPFPGVEDHKNISWNYFLSRPESSIYSGQVIHKVHEENFLYNMGKKLDFSSGHFVSETGTKKKYFPSCDGWLNSSVASNKFKENTSIPISSLLSGNPSVSHSSSVSSN